MNIKTSLYVAVLVAFLFGCSGSDDAPADGPGGVGDNIGPVAEAGSTQSVITGDVVTLDGSASFDRNGDRLNYLWTVVRTPKYSSVTVVNNPNTVNPNFIPDIDGEYGVSLVVNDGAIDSRVSVVSISASSEEAAPIANAGPNQNVSTGSQVTLDGRGSTDRNGDPLTYKWSISSVPAGSIVPELTNPTSVQPTFLASKVGKYVFSLSVNDGILDSINTSKVTITVVTPNSIPEAKTVFLITVATGSLVSLDGSASTDADGDPLTYKWSITAVPDGSNGAKVSNVRSLADQNTSRPSFTPDVDGTYIFSFIVNDGMADSLRVSTNIIATSGNIAPIANAGKDDFVKTGTLVELDGSASMDANGDSLSYSWSVISVADESLLNLLSDTTVVKPSFTPTVNADGFYVFELIVTDELGLMSEPDRVVIHASGIPIASIEIDVGNMVETSSQVTLTGTSSLDPAGLNLSYVWSIVSPAGSNVVRLTPDPGAPGIQLFTPDVDGDYVITLVVSNGPEKSIPVNITVIASTSQGTERTPIELVFGGSQLPFSSWTDRTHSYYLVTGLTVDFTYDVSISGLTQNADLSVFENADFSSGLLCESASLKEIESCAAVPKNTVMYIKVWGTSVPISQRTNFTLNVTPLNVVGNPQDEGSLTAPIVLNFSVAELPYVGTVGRFDSYYMVSNVVKGTSYSVSLTGLTEDAELYVYDRADHLAALCASTGVTTSEVCNVISTANALYIRVDGQRVVTGTGFRLDVRD